jgi:hypothetical protein
MAIQKIIAAGDVSEESEKWLKEHGAKFEDHFGVSLIELPEKAKIARGAYDWQYSISFGEDEDENGDYPPYCEVELYINASDTKIILKQ